MEIIFDRYITELRKQDNRILIHLMYQETWIKTIDLTDFIERLFEADPVFVYRKAEAVENGITF